MKNVKTSRQFLNDVTAVTSEQLTELKSDYWLAAKFEEKFTIALCGYPIAKMEIKETKFLKSKNSFYAHF